MDSGMVRRSPEIEAVVRRFLGAIEAADVATVRAAIHPGDFTVVLGSDPAERVLGPDSIDFLVLSAEHRRKDYTYNITNLDAFENDSVGWASIEARIEFKSEEPNPDLRYEPIDARISAVFLLEQATWRIVQWHFSTPLPDDPAVSGEELTDAMYEMIRSLEESSEVSELTSRLETNTVSLVFTDIVDSTVLVGRTGDEAWTATITQPLFDTERVTRSNDGIVVKTTGDGAMLAFGSARKAVVAAVELRRAALRSTTNRRSGFALVFT
jgi:adenylate cyclase